MQKQLAALAAGLLAAAPALVTPAPAAPPPPNAVRVRGVVQSFTPSVITVASAHGPVRVRLAPGFQVLSVVPTSRARIREGSFLGVASTTQPDGRQRAAEIVVFPEAARGAGEGSYAWDLPGAGGGHSRMTNGTVRRAGGSRMTNGTVRHGAGGSALTLQFKSGTGVGSQTLTLPPDIPVVTFVPGEAGQLRPGAHVIVNALRGPNGALTADRVLVGKDGLVPPM